MKHLTQSDIGGYSFPVTAKSVAETYHPRTSTERKGAHQVGAFFVSAFYGGSFLSHFGGPLTLCAVVITLVRSATLFITLAGRPLTQHRGKPTMSNLKILSSAIHQTDNLYSLNDLHKASGGEEKHTPNRFVRREQTKALINEINQTPNMALALKIVKGGKSPGTYACKELVYAYAMWISPKFHLHVIRAFDELQKPSQSILPLEQKPLPEDLQKMLDERLSQYTGMAYQKIKTSLERCARDAMTRGDARVELFDNWSKDSKVSFIFNSDTSVLVAFVSYLKGEIEKFEEQLKEIRAA